MTEFHLYLPRGFRTLEEAEIYNLILADPRHIQLARDSMIAMMRYLADLWIDSGKSGMDRSYDNPSDRHVKYVPPTNSEPLIVKFPGSTDEEMISEFHVFSLPVGLPISNLFYQLLGNETRWPVIRRDGTQKLMELVFAFDYENDRLGPRLAMHQFGMKVAMHWFAKLLDSPYSRHLSRCDECLRYFAYERAPRTPRKNGVYCPRCEGSGSAKRVKSSREKLRNKMLNAAAVAWNEWRFSRRRPDQREWVKTRVNKECGTNQQLKWVSQNLTEIQQRAEALRNATRKG